MLAVTARGFVKVPGENSESGAEAPLSPRTRTRSYGALSPPQNTRSPSPPETRPPFVPSGCCQSNIGRRGSSPWQRDAQNFARGSGLGGGQDSGQWLRSLRHSLPANGARPPPTRAVEEEKRKRADSSPKRASLMGSSASLQSLGTPTFGTERHPATATVIVNPAVGTRPLSMNQAVTAMTGGYPSKSPRSSPRMVGSFSARQLPVANACAVAGAPGVGFAPVPQYAVVASPGMTMPSSYASKPPPVAIPASWAQPSQGVVSRGSFPGRLVPDDRLHKAAYGGSTLVTVGSVRMPMA